MATSYLAASSVIGGNIEPRAKGQTFNDRVGQTAMIFDKKNAHYMGKVG